MNTAQQMNTNDLTIAGYTETAMAILKSLAERKRVSSTTAVDKLYYQLLKDGKKVVKQDFIQFFKDIEQLGYGSIVYGRGKNPTRFRWYYSLKDVGNAVIKPELFKEFHKLEKKENVVVMKRRGRPKGSKNTNVVKTSKVAAQITKTRQDQTNDVILIMTSLSGEKVPVRFSEIEKLASQIESIKVKLSQ